MVFLLVEKVIKLNNLLEKCEYAVRFESIAQDAISYVALHGALLENFKKDCTHLIAAENSLLSLCSYPSCTDGILYAFAFKFEINEKNIIYTRYICFCLFIPVIIYIQICMDLCFSFCIYIFSFCRP